VPLAGVPVHVSAPGFEAKDAAKRVTGPDGFVVTEPVTNLALVTIFFGSGARFPVPIVDEQSVVCRLRRDAAADKHAQLELRRERWEQRIYDLLNADTNRRRYLEQQLAAGRREDVLQAAQAGVKGLKEDLKTLREEGRQLGDAAQAGNDALDLKAGDAALKALDKRRDDLDHLAASVHKVLTEETSEQRRALRTLLERARLLESQAEYDEAMKLYRQVLSESPDERHVAERLNNSKASGRSPTATRTGRRPATSSTTPGRRRWTPPGSRPGCPAQPRRSTCWASGATG
jgi:tetratricopeptide (TPR) repeat protein